jgi:predicted O-methyltransferase YrrM
MQAAVNSPSGSDTTHYELTNGQNPVMGFAYSDLRPYLDSHVPPRHPELVAMERYAAETDFPILGPASCQFCYLLARLVGARRVYELGSGYGYSTAWFARAVDDNGGGVVHHVVWDEGLSEKARGHLGRLGYPPLGSGARTEVSYTVAEALGALRSTQETFDLIFNDIDKEAYPETIETVHSRLRQGGLFITDNVVWSGKVFDPSQDDDATRAIRRFTDMMCGDDRWVCSIVPIRDGLLVAEKR